MPCSHCNRVGHNIRTCPRIVWTGVRGRVTTISQAALLSQSLLVPVPQHESVSRIVPSGPLTTRPPNISTPTRVTSPSRYGDLITQFNHIQELERILIRGIEERRGLNVTRSQLRINRIQDLEQVLGLDGVKTLPRIKLKMVDNMDDHFNTENCPVCLDAYDSFKKNYVTTECKHIVCSDCMIEIVKRKKNNCPCCRAPFQELMVLPGVNSETFNSLSSIV